MLLSCGFRPDGTPTICEQDVLAEHGRGELGCAQQIERTLDKPLIGGSTAFHEFEQLGEERHKGLHLDGIAFEHNRIATYRDTRIERLFDYVEQAIAGSHHKRHVHGWRRGERDMR